jgi:TP901 family phage tail tape measure protein
VALDAGAVFATLGGRFDRAGFDQFGHSMYQARGQMEAAEKRMIGSQERVNESMRKMGQTAKVAAIGGVAALTAVVAGSVKVAADFDKSMRNVNSIAGLNEKQFRALSKSVLELSGKTAQAPKTLAEGMYQLVSSGFDARDSLKILKSSAIAASAGLTTTETATTAVAAALNAYHLPASKAQQVSDTLFQTVNRGVITFDELSHTIGLALPFANSLHVGLGQVGAAISTLTKEGIPAAEATTYLKNAMVTFLKPSKDLQAAIKKTGAESGEALVKQKGFQGALEAVAGTTDGTKAALQKLFPDIRASAAAFALTGTNAKTAEGDVKAFSSTAGATQKVFAEQSKSAAFQWQKFKAELQAAGVVIGSAVLPVLSKGITAVAQFVEHLQNTGKLASFGHSVAAGFKEAGHVFSDIASVGKTVAGVLLSIGRALDLGDASHLEALLAAIAGFKVAGVVAPLVAGLANGISTLAMNAASAPTLAAFFADLPIGPLGAVSLAVGALAAGLVLLGDHESAEAQVADHNAQAHRDQAEAIKSVSKAEIDAADKGLLAKRAKLDAADATKAAGEALKKYGRHSDEYKRALLDQQVATLEAKSAQDAYGKSVGAQNAENIKRVAKASKDLAQAQKDVRDTAPKTNAIAGGRSAGGLQESPSLVKARADAQANLTKRTQEYVQALARSNVSDASRARLMQSGSQITEHSARGVSLLIQAMQAVPKSVQSKILLDNQGALSKAGQLAFQLAKLGQQRTVTTILSNTSSARAAVLAFQALLQHVPPQKVAHIVATTSGKGEIDALRASIAAMQNKTVFIDTYERLHPQSVAAVAHKPRAAGRPAGAGETALVGEGAAPEWVVNPQAGTAAFVTGPTVMNLAPADYVIPTDSKYRGRALGLLADVAQSLGAAFAGGKKGKHHFVPKPEEYLYLSPDEFQARAENFQQKYDKLRQNKKTKRSDLAIWREVRNEARADYRKAKAFADNISKHEQEAEIGSQLMSNADATGDEHGYKVGRSKRLYNLRWTLQALQAEHGRAKPNSKWERDIRQAIAQVRGDLAATHSATEQPPSELTKKEQARLDRINSQIALATLTDDGNADDITAASSLVDFLTPILASAVKDPASRGGITAVTDLADQLATARSNLKTLTDPASATGGGTDPDTQAQIDQANQRAANAEAGMASQAALLQVLGGSGDLGIGAAAAPRVQVNVNTLHPGDPQTLRAIGDAAASGFGYQPGSPSPRERIGA